MVHQCPATHRVRQSVGHLHAGLTLLTEALHEAIEAPTSLLRGAITLSLGPRATAIEDCPATRNMVHAPHDHLLRKPCRPTIHLHHHRHHAGCGTTSDGTDLEEGIVITWVTLGLIC